MVDSLMYALLGFLAAVLCGLLVIPALNRRAERLARRRVEALFPLSIEELNAEKDHLRAEFAITQRLLERKAEEAQAVRHSSLDELGRRALRIEALDDTLRDRDQRIATLELDLNETSTRLVSTEEELTQTRHSLQATRDTLQAIEGAHRRTLDELGSTRGELEVTTARLNEARSHLETTRERLAARESEFADFLRRYNETLTDLDARRIALSDLETRIAVQTSRANEAERLLDEARRANVLAGDAIAADNAELRRRIDELADELLRAGSLEPQRSAAE